MCISSSCVIMITYFKGYLPHSYLAHLVVVRINESICAKLLQQCLGVCVCAPSHPYMRVHVHISHLTNANYLYICLYSWLLLASEQTDLTWWKESMNLLHYLPAIDFKDDILNHPLRGFFFTVSITCCCCCSLAQSNLIFCDPMDCSKSGLSILHHLLELAQTQVHWVGDAIQPSHPLSSPSPPAFNLS